ARRQRALSAALQPRPVGARAARAARGRGRRCFAAARDLGAHRRPPPRAQRSLPRSAAHRAAAAAGAPALPVHQRVRPQDARRAGHAPRRAAGRAQLSVRSRPREPLDSRVTPRRSRRMMAEMRPLVVAALLLLSSTAARATETYALFRLDPLGIAPDIVE